MTALSDALVAAQQKRGISARQIAAQSDPPITHVTVSKYLRGDHTRPDDDTLRAFASVLPIDITELRRLAGLPLGERAPYEPPPEANQLTEKQRSALSDLIRAIVNPGASGIDAAWPQQDEPLHVDVDDSAASPFDRPPAPNDFFGRRRTTPDQPDPETEYVDEHGNVQQLDPDVIEARRQYDEGEITDDQLAARTSKHPKEADRDGEQ